MTEKKALIKTFGPASRLAGWAALTRSFWFLIDYGMLVSLPQVAVGTFLASLTSVHYASALYFNTVGPAVVALARILLLALFTLGMWLNERKEKKRQWK